jgi:hypothetical protein
MNLIPCVVPDGDSAGGQHPVKAFLVLLRMVIFPKDFHLETLSTCHVVDADGAIGPGFYPVGGPVFTPTKYPSHPLSLQLPSWPFRSIRFTADFDLPYGSRYHQRHIPW